MKLETAKAIEERFFKFMQQYTMLPDRDIHGPARHTRESRAIRVGIGVSGGPDSVCLALLMKRYQRQLHLEPVVIHVNHHLRGAESDRDEAFVAKLARETLDFAFVRRDVELTPRELQGRSLEALARDKRYIEFDACRASLHLERIALAHTTNDNAETVLINMLRGTGISGISGIPPVRDFFIRPLLALSRDTVLRYLDLKKAGSVLDSTNELPDHVRNRIRHEILPLLTGINPGFMNHVLALSGDLREIDGLLNRLARQAYDRVCSEGGTTRVLLSREKLSAYEPPVIKMVVQIAIRNMLGTYYNPRREHVDFIMDMLQKTGDNSLSLDLFPGNLRVYKNKEHLIFDTSTRT